MWLQSWSRLGFCFLLSVLSILWVGYTFSEEVRCRTRLFFYGMGVGEEDLSLVERIYIINLDGQEERYEGAVGSLLGLGLMASHERFPAVNGGVVEFIQDGKGIYLKELFPKIKEYSGIFRLEYGGKLVDSYVDLTGGTSAYVDLQVRDPRGPRFVGITGNYCSHREIWNDMVEKGYKRVLILEDDVCFCKDARIILNLALRNIREAYDILFLGLIEYSLDSLDEGTREQFFRKVVKHIASTEAYIITDKGARELLEGTKQYRRPLDRMVSDLIEEGKVRAYSTYPLISRQVGPSMISLGKLE